MSLASADETQRLLGKLDAGLEGLRGEHQRHADLARDSFIELRMSITDIRIELAGLRGERRAYALMRYLATAALAILGGALGGHVRLPGGH